MVRRAGLLLALAALAAACAPPPPAVGQGAPTPAEFPEAYYRQAEALGQKVLRVDPQRSLVVVEVRRGGALARLGHDHVVASRDVRGYVAVAEGRADLRVPLDRLSVDEPELRGEAGFDKELPATAIEGTRRNMLEKVLESARYPDALIRVTRTAADRSTLNVAITLHGTTRSWEIPAQIDTLADGLVVSGRLRFKQSDFGIVPLAVLGGALQVEDRVDLRFRILAGGG